MTYNFRAIALADRGDGTWRRDQMTEKDSAYGMGLEAGLTDFVKGRSPTNAATTVAARAFLTLTMQHLLTQAIRVLGTSARGEFHLFTRNYNMLWANSLTSETYTVGSEPGQLSVEQLFAGIGAQFEKADLLYQGPFESMLKAIDMTDRIADENGAFRLHLTYEFS